MIMHTIGIFWWQLKGLCTKLLTRKVESNNFNQHIVHAVHK